MLLFLLVLLVLGAGGLLLAARMGVPQAQALVGRVWPGFGGGGDDGALALVPPEASLVMRLDVQALLEVPLVREVMAGEAMTELPVLGDVGLAPGDVKELVLAGDLAAAMDQDTQAFLGVVTLNRDIPPDELLSALRSDSDSEWTEVTVEGRAGLELADADDGIPLRVVPISERLVAVGNGEWLARTVRAAESGGHGLSADMQRACRPAERDEMFWACALQPEIPEEAAQDLDPSQLGPMAPPFSAQDVESNLMTGGYDELAGLSIRHEMTMTATESAEAAEGWLAGMLPMAGMFLGPAASGLTHERDGTRVRVNVALSPQQLEELAASAMEFLNDSDFLGGGMDEAASPPPRSFSGRTVRTAKILKDGVALDAPEGEPIMRVSAGEEYPIEDDTLDGWYRLGNTPSGTAAWMHSSEIELGELTITDGTGSMIDDGGWETSSGGSAGGGLGEAMQRGKAKRTMADLRMAATAIESYSIDQNAYPVVQPPGRLGELASLLEPTYLKAVPAADGWGRPFLYWSDGKEYVVASAGSDGRFERPEASYTASVAPRGGESEDLARDLVFATGEFLQYVP